MSELLWPMLHEVKMRLAQIEAHLGANNPDWNKPDVDAPPDTTNPSPESDPDAAAIDKQDLNEERVEE